MVVSYSVCRNQGVVGATFFRSLEPKAIHPRSWSVGLSTPLNDFSSETPGPIFFKLHVEPSVKGGLKICSNGHRPLIKMATMHIYGKNI